MSRVGRKPIPIPDGTKITYKEHFLVVEGKKGKLSRSIHPAVDLEIEDGLMKKENLIKKIKTFFNINEDINIKQTPLHTDSQVIIKNDTTNTVISDSINTP